MAKKKKSSQSGKKKATSSSAKKKTRTSGAKKVSTKKKKTTAGSSAAGVKKKKTAAPKKSAAGGASVKKKTSASTGAAGTKKKTAKSSSKPSTSKSSSSKASAPKKAATEAVASKPAKKPSRKKAASSSDAKAGSAKSGATKPKQETSLADAKAAALRLAAAAGLRPVESFVSNGDESSVSTKRLTKSPLAKRDLDKYRAILLEKRNDVFGDVTDMETEALGSKSGSLSSMPQHMADQGSDEYDQSLALGLAESQRRLLKDIDDALDRIDGGTYGICESLGIAIPKARLEATPWTRYSLEGARLNDQRQFMR